MPTTQFKRSKSLLAMNIQEAVKNLEKVDCTNLWLRKMKTLFNVFDFKRSGFMIKECCEDLAARFQRYANFSQDQKDYMTDILLSWWKEVARDAENIPWETYYKMKYVIITDPALREAEEEIADEFITKMFQFQDMDRDGVISLKEWRIFFQALGVASQEDADETFKTIDLNEDGVMSLSEYKEAFHDFTCNQKYSKYTYMFGPLADV